MIVFKCYMKILRQNVTLVIIYLGIFFSVALVMQMAAGKSEDSLYANTSIDIGVVKEIKAFWLRDLWIILTRFTM